ncbi:MAG: MBL fold metallo-hydrolase [Micromonosporaceae bacterium]|nr:MBL fold metallo-hydrolase [Micromonosporaceae bacterium]
MAGEAGDRADPGGSAATRKQGLAHVTEPVAAVAGELPGWARLVRAPNPGPMTLEGTNTWVLRAPGAEQAVVVDPGPADESHLRAVASHGPVAAVLVTHGHPDHVDGLDRFRELTGAPLAGADGLAAGPLAGLAITMVETPGHTADSVCLLVETAGRQPAKRSVAGGHSGRAQHDSQRAVLTGDTILGRGTTVVAWPDGDLGDYLASLRRLADLVGVPVLPGHGPALADCAAAASYYLAHRRARLEQVRAAVAAGAETPAEVVRAVYADVDRALWPAAEWSVRAQLAYLRAEHRESAAGPPQLDEP